MAVNDSKQGKKVVSRKSRCLLARYKAKVKFSFAAAGVWSTTNGKALSEKP